MPRFFRRKGNVPVSMPRPKRKISPGLVSRRSMLKGFFSFLAVKQIRRLNSLVQVKPATQEEKKVVTAIESLDTGALLRTALREGKSVRQAIESQPDARTLEQAFVKHRPGEMTVSSSNRKPNSVLVRLNREDARSDIHTHVLPHFPSPKWQWMMASTPSATDVLRTISRVWPSQKYPRFRFTHMAAINPVGKVMGYYTIHLGKRIRSLLSMDDITPESMAFWESMKVLNETRYLLSRGTDDQKMESYMDRALDELQKVHALGLRVRATPMPGWVYRYGMFQTKG